MKLVNIDTNREYAPIRIGGNNNLIFEAFEYVPRYTCDHAEKHETGKGRTINRSMIHPQYANRFIREFILDADGNL